MNKEDKEHVCDSNCRLFGCNEDLKTLAEASIAFHKRIRQLEFRETLYQLWEPTWEKIDEWN